MSCEPRGELTLGMGAGGGNASARGDVDDEQGETEDRDPRHESGRECPHAGPGELLEPQRRADAEECRGEECGLQDVCGREHGIRQRYE